jgi:hypothetical protein
MSLLSRILGRDRAGAPADAHVDPCAGDAVAHEWRDRLAQGNWADLGAFLQSFQDTEVRDFYVDILADTLEGRPTWLDAWVGQEPAALLPRLFRGTHGTKWAWDARGGGSAKTVSDDGWRRFFERLQGAHDDLTIATELDPTDAGPWAMILMVIVGLQLGRERLTAAFDAAQQRHPWHQAAHRSMLQGLAAKWGGSNELMFEFARDTHAHAPEGLGVHTVLAEAHVEGWLDADLDDGYWKRPGVREEIMSAAERYLYSPQRVVTPRELRNRNVFAFCFWKLQDRDRLREQLACIDGTITTPWTLFSRPTAKYAAAQRFAR